MVEDAISFWTDIQRYEDMLAADPRSYCFVPLSDLYRKLGLLDDAISVAKKGSDQHPDYPPGFFALGAALNDKGEKDQARAALEHAVSLKGDDLEALKLLGQLYVENGEIDRAKVVLGQALRQDPDDTETELLLHSIDPRFEKPRREEEVVEEVEIIEDLTEVLDNGGRQVSAEVAAAVAGGWGEVPSAAPAAGKDEAASMLERSTDFWGLGIPGEAAPVEELEPLEEEFSGFDASDDYVPREEPAPLTAGRATEPAGRDPLSTATLAELYVSQGHIDKALGIYQQLIGENPGNASYRQRLAELIALAEQQLQSAEPHEPAVAATRQTAPLQHAPVQQQEALQQEPQRQAPVQAQPAAQQEGVSPQQPARELRGPALQEPARQEAVPADAAGHPPQADLEAQLLGWLENIRRRRDVV